MRVTLSTEFRESAVKVFRIKPEWALSVVTSPARTEHLDANGANLQFFLGSFPAAIHGVTLLLYGFQTPDGVLSLARGFKIYPDLCDGIEGKRPTEILEALVERFGAEISIGGRKQNRKLLFSQIIQLEFHPSVNAPSAESGISFHSRSLKAGGFAETLIKKLPDDPEGRAQIGLVYGFPFEEYLDWLRSHR